MIVEINNIPFTLLQEKALYKQDERLLIIADIHLGKANHFRKEGIAIPADSQLKDYHNLADLFGKIKPLQVYFLGDLFHSSFNRDWHHFTDLILQFKEIKFTLVRGNHDIINNSLFKEMHIEVVDEIENEHFIYTHEPLEHVPAGKVNIVGHIHPGIVISGSARQSLKIPCFYVSSTLVVLPAFGILTGLYNMGRSKEACLYCISPGGIKQLV